MFLYLPLILTIEKCRSMAMRGSHKARFDYVLCNIEILEIGQTAGFN